MTTPRDGWDRDENEVLSGLEDQLDAVRERHRNDPSLELLRGASADVLPREVQVTVDRHLADSAWSRALLEGAMPDEGALDRDGEAKILARIQRESSAAGRAAPWRAWLRPAFVGTAVAAVGVVAWVVLRAPDDRTRPLGTPESTVSVAQPAAAPPPLLPFDKPDVRLSMAALTWRGSTGADNPLLADLKPALDAYRQSDYAAAEQQFTALSARYPDAFEVHFYQGITRLFLDNAAGAIQSLAAAEPLADATFIPDVRWYRAVAEQRSGNAAEAVTRLDALCRGKAGNAERACAALEQLASTSPAARP